MKYLKRVISDGVYRYIPISSMEFYFVELDDNEYRVDMRSNGNMTTLFEKIYISDVDKCMQKIMKLSDGVIVDAMELFF
jgi:hypothetical protein